MDSSAKVVLVRSYKDYSVESCQSYFKCVLNKIFIPNQAVVTRIHKRTFGLFIEA